MTIQSEAITEPSQGKTCSLGHAHDVPAPGDGMAESMHTAALIKRRAIRSGKDYAGGADSCADRSGSHDAHAYSACCLIPRPCNYWKTFGQTGCRRAFGGYTTRNL